MSAKPGLFGLTSDVKQQLAARLASRRAVPDEGAAAPEIIPRAPALGDPKAIAELDMMRRAGRLLRIEDPYFRAHAGIAGAVTRIGGAEYDNFVSYNYLGLNGDPRVSAAAKAAIGKGKMADIQAELQSNLLPGVIIVPAMVIAIESAQRAGIAYNRQ